MTLELDLGSSHAKLARAREHLGSLKRETTVGITQEGPYAVRFSQVDEQTGWCTITLVPQKVEKPRLSAILGDVIHNMRCALDYVVTALVDASQTQLTTAHQFPIYKDAAGYAGRVGSLTAANPKGPLQGVVHGLTVIEKWQPYHTKPNPRADPLWVLHRFSNADKHREPVAFLPTPVGQLKFSYNGIVIDKDEVPEVANWRPDQEIDIGRVRFDPPRAYNLRAQGELSLDVRFETPAWRGDPELSVTLSDLDSTIDRVAVMLDLFDKL